MKVQEADYNDVLNLRHEAMYANQSIEMAKVENDHEGIHLGIYTDKKLVSCISIYMEDRKLQFRKLATKADFRQQGYATTLVKYIIDYYNQFELDKLWANSRLETLPFYKKLGFEKTDETFSKNGYDYVVIEYTPQQ